ncbi:MAG: S-methyl-5-thioribose-1-phosphate isomerase, partial [candidate division WOR-3 bacterium]
MEIKPVFLTEEDVLVILDQRKLPLEEVYISCKGVMDVAEAIKTLAVRGAPLIGIVAAYGVYIGLKDFKGDYDSFLDGFRKVKEELASTRPTAKNLFYVLERLEKLVLSLKGMPVEKIKNRLRAEAIRIEEEEAVASKLISEYGAKLVPYGAKVLTHCNTGSLATAGLGTALGIVKKAWEDGKITLVLVDETRPLLQGSRLTAWELEKAGIPYKIITDNMAGYFMYKGSVDCVIVGADRITKRGDVANKIGTYSLSVLAKYHGIPFIVAAPTSTFDFSIDSVADIVIE